MNSKQRRRYRRQHGVLVDKVKRLEHANREYRTIFRSIHALRFWARIKFALAPYLRKVGMGKIND